MSIPLKFNFDTSFARAGDPDEGEEKEVTFSEGEMKSAREEAYQDGVAAGLAKAQDSAENLLTCELQVITGQLDDMNKGMLAQMYNIRAEASDLALQIAKKLSPALIARAPLAEVESLLDECLSHLSAAPHVVIRIADTLAGPLRERVDSFVCERGYEGKIMILDEPEMQRGDCRIEWADGGIQRDTQGLQSVIERAVMRHISLLQDAASSKASDENETAPQSPPETEGMSA